MQYKNPIKLVKVDLGVRRIHVPVADLRENNEGKTIVITGGMDGDEYTGIEAAYKLIDIFVKRKFSGRLIIIPVVNIPGFENAISLNPLDMNYPKYIYPGKATGNPTERLMHWLNTTFLKDAEVWLDLHAGAITERLNPFVVAQETGNKAVDERTKRLLTTIGFPLSIYEPKDKRSHSYKLAQQGASYIIFESGQLGQARAIDVKRHVDWVLKTINSLTSKNNSQATIKFYRKIAITTAKYAGRWQSAFVGTVIAKGDVLGILQPLVGIKSQTVVARDNGVFLWGKAVVGCQKGDILVAYAKYEDIL